MRRPLSRVTRRARRAGAAPHGTGAGIRAALLAAAVTAAVVCGLLTLADPAVLLETLSRADPGPLVAALALVPIVQWLRAWRFGLLMSGTLKAPELDLVRIAVLLNVFNFLLPFRVGEASFPILMKRRYGMEYSRAAGMLVLVRLMDACTVTALLCAATAAAFDAPFRGWGRPALLAAGLLAVLGLVLLPRVGGALRSGPGALLGRWPRLKGIADGLMSGGGGLRGVSGHASAIGLTLGVWAALTAIAVLTMIAVDPGVGLAPAVVASASTNLAFALPVTGVAGLGPAQAAWATALNLAGTPWDTAIASALAGYAVFVLSALTLGGLALLVPASGDGRGSRT